MTDLLAHLYLIRVLYQIMRGVLGGGDLLGPYCVVDLSPGEVRHIIADPVRG